MDLGECEWWSLSFGTDSSPAAYGCYFQRKTRTGPALNSGVAQTQNCVWMLQRSLGLPPFPPASFRVLELHSAISPSDPGSITKAHLQTALVCSERASESRAVHVHCGISLLFLLSPDHEAPVSANPAKSSLLII